MGRVEWKVARMVLFSLFLCGASAVAVTEANNPPLASTSRDAMFAHEKPYLTCSFPIDAKKNPACAGICMDMKISYDEMKHVNGRDVDPKHALAKPERLDANDIPQRQILVPTKPYQNVAKNGGLSMAGLSTYEVGNPNDKDCKWATIWVHGADPRKGDLGVTDNIFGAAFNRMKRLAIDNHGLYYSPTLQTFGDEDIQGVAALIKHIRTRTCPKGKIILNCGSAGTSVCWDLAENENAVKDISGIVLIGGGPSGDLKKSLAVKNRIPIMFAMGEKDHPQYLREMALKLYQADPNYPIRNVIFSRGGHMTPLRMLDWRETMNCMLTQAPDVPAASQSSSAPKDKAEDTPAEVEKER